VPSVPSAAKPTAGAPGEPECPPGPGCAGDDGHCVQATPDDPAEAPRVVVDAAGVPSLGPTDARVTLIEFDDFGIEGTPTFLFNGRIIRGARDVAFFRGLVDEELARK
jgi:hypothetical protein